MPDLTPTTAAVVLSPAEQAKLAEANHLLWDLTRDHHHMCRCLLCEARWRTDVSDPPRCWTIPDVDLANP